MWEIQEKSVFPAGAPGKFAVFSAFLAISEGLRGAQNVPHRVREHVFFKKLRDDGVPCGSFLASGGLFWSANPQKLSFPAICSFFLEFLQWLQSAHEDWYLPHAGAPGAGYVPLCINTAHCMSCYVLTPVYRMSCYVLTPGTEFSGVKLA